MSVDVWPCMKASMRRTAKGTAAVARQQARYANDGASRTALATGPLPQISTVWGEGEARIAGLTKT